jgi:DNA mismatch repair protein MutS
MKQTRKPTTLSPMMQQYMAIKQAHPDTLVLFRLGDFYELFFDDAILASQTLGIVLTARDAGDQKAPMCGVPYHSVDKYIEPLIEAGFQLAICEQTDDIDTATKIVKRVVTRIITPGTFTDYSGDDARYLAAFHHGQFAYANVATGDVFVESLALDDVRGRLSTLAVQELLVDASSTVTTDVARTTVVSYEPATLLAGFNDALGLLLSYVKQTSLHEVTHFKAPILQQPNEGLLLDASTIAQLELFESSYKKTKLGSLRSVIDHTSTSMGRRLLAQLLARPMTNRSLIETRLSLVEMFVQSVHYTADTRHLLTPVYDMDRLLAKISTQSATPKDLAQLRDTLTQLPKLVTLLSPLDHPLLATWLEPLPRLSKLSTLLREALVEIPPLSRKEGGIFQLGYHEELDRLMTIHERVQADLDALEQAEQRRTGIKKLKIGYNKPFGYYIEITKGQLSNLDATGYVRKQTLVNAERFVSDELKAIEAQMLTAEDRRVAMEESLFASLCSIILEDRATLQAASWGLAHLDVIANFAYLAETHHYTKPTFGTVCQIEQGRHPVVETLIPHFVANDTQLDHHTRMLLITGPNMSGKSTYIRQVATIAILAQMGSFVPATHATLPVFDHIFTRIGASDDVLSGQSTFMVEMREVHQALSKATSNSLLIFDEIGRGTATFDGVAIAQATLEYLHTHVKAMTLFSTHYHELTALEHTLGTLRNIHVSAEERKGELVFHHHVLPGAIDKSYGIHVAKLANLPPSLLKRAQVILHELESRGVQEVTLFAQDVPDDLATKLQALNLDNLSPKEALELLYAWKANHE